MTTAIIVLISLILINGVFVIGEIALVSARKTKLDADAQQGDELAGLVLENSLAPSRILSTIQIAITLIGILIGVYSDDVAKGMERILAGLGFHQGYYYPLSLALVVIIVTFVTILIGELVPKRIGLINPERISKVMIRPLLSMAYLTHPATWILSRSGDAIIHLLGIKPSIESRVTEEEIKAMVQEGIEDGEVQEIEQDIVERVFHLGDRKVSSLMTHHSDMVWLDINDSPEQLQAKLSKELHSVYPVCDGDLDEVVGVVFVKDLFLSDMCGESFTIKDHIKPAQFVAETISAYETLALFKQHKIHYGLVVDEYGSTMGVVTLNDILEALVGEFKEPSPDEPRVIQREDGTWLADGHMPFYEFAYEFDIQGLDMNEIKFDTLAGLAINVLKRIPRPGEKFEWYGFEFEIVDMDGNRVDKLLIKKLSEVENGDHIDKLLIKKLSEVE